MLVEDHPDYRETIILALERENDIKLVSQFGTAEEALRCLEKSKAPDLILLDLNLPGMSGTESIPWINRASPASKIIVLTQSNREADVIAALAAGADGYLLKSATRHKIFEAVRTAMNGGATIDPEVAIYLLNTLKSNVVNSAKNAKLSERELEVLMYLSEGLVQKEISSKLGITPNTVATHIRRIYEKLQVKNVASAISKAYKSGIL